MFVRRLTAIEKSGLVLAALLVLGGGWIAMRPVEISFVPAGGYRGARGGGSEPVHLSNRDVRICGCVGVVLGVGIGSLVICRGRR